jgi:hypothetical protein
LGSGNLVSESVPKLKIGETENWLGVLMQGANYCGDGFIAAINQKTVGCPLPDTQ